MGKNDSDEQSHRFSLPAPHFFDTSAFSTHHFFNTSHSSTPTPHHSSYSGSATPHAFDRRASRSISTSPTMFAHAGNQSHQESILAPASADSANKYHPHFVQADKETDEDRSSTSLDIPRRYSCCVSCGSRFPARRLHQPSHVLREYVHRPRAWW